MRDGHYPEHFFETQVAPMQEEDAMNVSMLPKEDESIDATTFIAKPNIVVSRKAIEDKNKAFAKVLKYPKEVAKALEVSEALLTGKQRKQLLKKNLKRSTTSKQMVRNAMYLKAFAVLNADKLYGKAKELGLLGTLLKAMMVKTKKTPVQQYADALKLLAKHNEKGLPRYVLHAIAAAMLGDGVISMGPIASKPGQYVKISAKDVGFTHPILLLDDLAASVNSFTEALKTVDKNAMVNLHNRWLHSPFTTKDYNRLFRATCYGAGKNYNFCFDLQDKAACKKYAASKGKHHQCKWIGGWSGKLASEVQP